MNVLFGDPTGALSEPFTIRATNANPTVGLLALDPDGGLIEPFSERGLLDVARRDHVARPTRSRLHRLPIRRLKSGPSESRVGEARVVDPTDDIIVLTPLAQFQPVLRDRCSPWSARTTPDVSANLQRFQLVNVIRYWASRLHHCHRDAVFAESSTRRGRRRDAHSSAKRFSTLRRRRSTQWLRPDQRPDVGMAPICCRHRHAITDTKSHTVNRRAYSVGVTTLIPCACAGRGTYKGYDTRTAPEFGSATPDGGRDTPHRSQSATRMTRAADMTAARGSY